MNEAAAWYTEELTDIVKTPVIPENFRSSWAQYTIQLENKEKRDGLQAFLEKQGIPTMVYYPIPLHQQEVYQANPVYQACPATKRLCERVLSLPMHPYLGREDVRMVSGQIRTYLK